MSRIYFHSLSGEAELWGGERAWMGNLVSKMAIGILDPFWCRDHLAELLDEQHKPPKQGELITWAERTGLAISTMPADDLLTWKGHRIEAFSLLLNTVLRAGSDPMRLAARMHGQCEIHLWWEGKDRAWVADLIEEGLESGVFRRDIGQGYPQGWENVVTFLRERDDEPVVQSYSVCEQFPDPYVIGWEPPPDDCERSHDDTYEQWSNLDGDQQWEAGMAWLREREGMRLDRDDFRTMTFRHGLSAFDIIAPDFRERLDKAFSD